MPMVWRDAYARQELHRATIKPSHGETCNWCGNLNRRGNLFQYRIETDAGRKFFDDKLFCSVGCRDSYYYY